MNVLSCHAYNGGSVIVWAGVTADRRTDLVVIPGTLNSQLYIDEVLLPHVLPCLRRLGVNNSTFQDDNARPHRARIVDAFLQQNNVWNGQKCHSTLAAYSMSGMCLVGPFLPG